MKVNIDRNSRRQIRVRAKIEATKERPRIAVFRSNKYFYAQVINGEKGQIMVSSSSFEVKKESKTNKTEQAKLVGLELAKKMKKKGIESGVLDRKSYSYLGRVKAFTEGLREGGIKI